MIDDGDDDGDDDASEVNDIYSYSDDGHKAASASSLLTLPRMDSMENFSPGCPPPPLVRLTGSSSLNLSLQSLIFKLQHAPLSRARC